MDTYILYVGRTQNLLSLLSLVVMAKFYCMILRYDDGLITGKHSRVHYKMSFPTLSYLSWFDLLNWRKFFSKFKKNPLAKTTIIMVILI